MLRPAINLEIWKDLGLSSTSWEKYADTQILAQSQVHLRFRNKWYMRFFDMNRWQIICNDDIIGSYYNKDVAELVLMMLVNRGAILA